MAELTTEYVAGPYEFIEIVGASHWIPDERPAELAAAIVGRARIVTSDQSAPPAGAS